MLEVPVAMLDAIQDRGPLKLERKRYTAYVPVSPHGVRSLGEMLFAAKSRAKLRLLVQIPEANRKSAYEVFARQMFEGEEVGRVNWRLAPKQKDR
jgi:serine protease